MKIRLWGVSLIALATLGLGDAAWAQQQVAAADDAGDTGEVIVTGTRQSGTKARDSSAPIEVVQAESLQTTGLPNLTNELDKLVPAFSTPAYGADTAALTTSAVLRNLSPNHVLVLVNGKRLHASANIVADPGPQQGANAVDLDLIPAAAIDHIEILTDGAAAQYGSDAIAGVINIILKNSDHGGAVSVTAGEYYGSPFDEVHKGGDGFQIDSSANIGLPLGETGYLNLTGEYKHHDNSNISGPDLRGSPGVPADPYQSRIYGDPESSLENLAFNTGVDVDGTSFYATGTYGHRHAKAFENYRLTTKAAGVVYDGMTLPNPYPLGFEPAETLTQDDYQLTVGVKREIAGWTFDLSSTYGADNEDIGNVGGLNIDLYAATGQSPSVFRTGNLNDGQWTNNLDITRPFDIGLFGPLNVAFGGEYRYETFELDAGDPASRYGAGSQANPGFSLTDAHDVYRQNYAGYVDLALKPIEGLQIDTAGRYERFTDSGKTTNGKVSARYDFIPEFAVRGTVSNGFRAPSLAQEYFSATNVGPGYASAQLPVNSAGARLLGAEPLKPETSNNYSFGIVSTPLPRLKATVDAYQINIHNRIIDTGQFASNPALGLADPVTRAIELNGNQVEAGDSTYAQYFANALTSHTRGVDVTLSYPVSFGDWGDVNYTVAANHNQTVAVIPQGNAARYQLDASAIGYLTTAQPKTKIVLSAYWEKEPYNINLRGTYYGQSSTVNLNTISGGYYADVIDPTFIVDLELGYTIGGWHFAAGANNLFNTFPNKVNPIGTAPVNAEIYNTFSPYGYQGGYYYTRVTYSFDTPEAPEPAPAVAAPMPVPPPPPPPPQVAQPEAARSFQVFFDFDKSDITAAAAKVIESAAEAVKAGHVVRITVTGHTDTVGTSAYNQVLSEKRAAAVKAGLIADGVSGGEIVTNGVGKTGLLVPTGDGVREPQNRRAEIVLQ